jgi:hypothetical protein
MTSPAPLFVLLFVGTLLINSFFRGFSFNRSQLLRSMSFWQTLIAFGVGILVSLTVGEGILQAAGVHGIPHWVDVVFTGFVVASGSENLTSLHDLGDGNAGAQGGSAPPLDQSKTLNVTGTLTIIE